MFCHGASPIWLAPTWSTPIGSAAAWPKPGLPNWRFLGAFCGFSLWTKQQHIIRQRPPGLIQHVLTVLVFGSWVLPPPRLPPSSRSLRLCPWANILLHGRLDICSDLLPAAPPPPVQKQDAQHMFLQHRGGTRTRSTTMRICCWQSKKRANWTANRRRANFDFLNDALETRGTSTYWWGLHHLMQSSLVSWSHSHCFLGAFCGFSL